MIDGAEAAEINKLLDDKLDKIPVSIHSISTNTGDFIVTCIVSVHPL